jgi:hypothetical protein
MYACCGSAVKMTARGWREMLLEIQTAGDLIGN